MSYTPLPGYPTKISNKQYETIDWVAPNPYVVGGVSFPASSFGWGAFDSGYGSVSQSGDYRAEVRFSNDNAQQTAKIVVFLVADGLQAGAIDLSAEVFRLSFFGV